MPVRKYTVVLVERVTYTIEIKTDDTEADGEKHAIDIATEMWPNSLDPRNDFCGEGHGVTVERVFWEDVPDV